MRVFIDFMVVAVILGLVSCKSASTMQGTDVIAKTRISQSKIVVSLRNSSDQIMVFPGVRADYIELLVDNQWERLPYTSCECGVPCSPAIPQTVKSGATMEFFWDMYARVCNGTEPIETLQTKGSYRIKFDYQLLDKGMIVKSSSIWVKFDLPI
ncbi:MAG: hypothetical protein RIC35_16035 [Marinoscillum sp.]